MRKMSRPKVDPYGKIVEKLILAEKIEKISLFNTLKQFIFRTIKKVNCP